jgi:hypothetical protein
MVEVSFVVEFAIVLEAIGRRLDLGIELLTRTRKPVTDLPTADRRNVR